MDLKLISYKKAYLLLAVLAAGSLSIIACSLLPIARWASTQNKCIERTYRIDGENKAGYPSKVWSCNGGGT
tara:strand:+ start:810 stop:1022 length:213 start_codon:yes stop_codon:yes gene_type:complete